MTADELIKHLSLEKHPEGGYFRETYRSAEGVDGKSLPERFSGKHSFSTSIYFLLRRNEFSAFHEIKQDEIWHFYSGAPVDVHVISQGGDYDCLKLGAGFEKGDLPQGVVYAGDIFGATVSEHSEYDYSLVGCTVSPGFEFDDFRLVPEGELLHRFPEHKDIIKKLTRN